MKLWKRRTALTIALLVFFVIAPIIILYATGYRYNFSKKSFGKVGMIIVESEPKNVQILLNDVEVANNTTHRIRNLAPRSYNVKIQQEGYQTWEKNLSVESALVTWISHAKTFYSEPHEDIIFGAKNIQDINVSPNEKTATFISKNGREKLNIIDLKSKETTPVFPLLNTNSYTQEIQDLLTAGEYSISEIYWSYDNEKLFFTLSSDQYIYYIVVTIKNPSNLYLLEDLEIKNLAWDLLDSNFLYYLSGSDLIKVNINDQAIRSVVVKNTNDFSLSGNDIFYSKELTSDETKDVTTIINSINKNQTEEKLTDLKNIATFTGLNFKYKVNDNGVMLALSGNNTLYLIDDTSVRKLNEHVTGFEWADNDKNFLYYNDETIWHYKIEKDANTYHPQYKLNRENKLIGGLSGVSSASWYSDDEHILFVEDNNVFIIELDNRDESNIFTLISDIKDSSSIHIDKSGENLFTVITKDNIDNYTRLELF